MTRIIGAILVLGLVSGCSAYFSTSDEISMSGQGVLASYDQSAGDLTDMKRENASVNKRRMKPVELASDQLWRHKDLAELGGLTIDQRKLRANTGSDMLTIGKSRSVSR